MFLANYTTICINFANDTKEWGNIDPYKFYTTQGVSWVETADNAHGGLDVSWAFQMSNEQIKRYAHKEYLKQLQAAVEQAIDEDFDSEQVYVLVKQFANI